MDGAELVFDRSLERPRNAVVRPSGWYCTESPAPATVQQLSDGRIQLDFWDDRPDPVEVLVRQGDAWGRQREQRSHPHQRSPDRDLSSQGMPGCGHGCVRWSRSTAGPRFRRRSSVYPRSSDACQTSHCYARTPGPGGAHPCQLDTSKLLGERQHHSRARQSSACQRNELTPASGERDKNVRASPASAIGNGKH